MPTWKVYKRNYRLPLHLWRWMAWKELRWRYEIWSESRRSLIINSKSKKLFSVLKNLQLSSTARLAVGLKRKEMLFSVLRGLFIKMTLDQIGFILFNVFNWNEKPMRLAMDNLMKIFWTFILRPFMRQSPKFLQIRKFSI